MDMDMVVMVDTMGIDMALDTTVMDGGDVRRGKPNPQLKRPPKPQPKHLLIPMDMDIDMDMVMDTMVDIMDMDTVMDGGDVRRGKLNPLLKRPPKPQPKHLLIPMDMDIDMDMVMDTMVDIMDMVLDTTV